MSEAVLNLELAALDSTSFDDGLFLDPNCTGAASCGVGIELLASGVQGVTQIPPNRAPRPTDLSVVTGGWVDTGVGTMFGATASLEVPCVDGTDVYVAHVIRHESDMPVTHTSGTATRIECVRLVADGGRAHDDQRDGQGYRLTGVFG